MCGGYFPTEVLMKALVTYPIGVELGETKNSLKTRFKEQEVVQNRCMARWIGALPWYPPLPRILMAPPLPVFSREQRAAFDLGRLGSHRC